MNYYKQQELEKLNDLNEHLISHDVKDYKIKYKGYSVFLVHFSGRTRIGMVSEKLEHLTRTIDILLKLV